MVINAIYTAIDVIFFLAGVILALFIVWVVAEAQRLKQQTNHCQASGFIEIIDQRGIKRFLNTRHIDEVSKNENGTCQIFMTFFEEKICYEVEESFESIQAKIRQGQWLESEADCE
jgi:hypothetical protein